MANINEIFNKARVGDRQLNELIGLARGMLADGKINQAEAEYLQKWLVANEAASEHPIVGNLLDRVTEMLEDGDFDQEEADDLFGTLNGLAGGEFDLGEVLKSSGLPLTDPKPKIVFGGSNFCFTGLFAYGNRKACEAIVLEKGSTISGLNQSLNYLVVGIYASSDWIHSSFGRKIEKALDLNAKGALIKIISEDYWVEHL